MAEGKKVTVTVGFTAVGRAFLRAIAAVGGPAWALFFGGLVFGYITAMIVQGVG